MRPPLSRAGPGAPSGSRRALLVAQEHRYEAAIAAVAPEEQRLSAELSAIAPEARRLHNCIEDMKGAIRVFVRTRPLNAREQGLEGGKGGTCLSFPDPEQREVLVTDPASGKGTPYLFDRAFPGLSTQEEVFADAGSLAVNTVEGSNVCCLAYGQTGSGKTWTLAGTPEQPGIARRSCDATFALIDQLPHGVEAEVSATMCELYLADFFDLLNPNAKERKKARKCKGSGQIPGLHESPARDAGELHALFQTGEANRTTRATSMNARSSRSHLLFTIKVSCTGERRTCGKLIIADLAGSERLGKSQVDGEGVKEAIAINKSLTALGNVIEALSKAPPTDGPGKGRGKHIPYRDHELTLALQDAIGGTAKTLLFVNASPARDNYQETRCSLAFAQRAKHIVQGDRLKMEGNQAALEEMTEALDQLRTRQHSIQDALRGVVECTMKERRALRRVREAIDELDIAIEMDEPDGHEVEDG